MDRIYIKENRMMENNFFKLLFKNQAHLLPYDINDRMIFIAEQIYIKNNQKTS